MARSTPSRTRPRSPSEKQLKTTGAWRPRWSTPPTPPEREAYLACATMAAPTGSANSSPGKLPKQLARSLPAILPCPRSSSIGGSGAEPDPRRRPPCPPFAQAARWATLERPPPPSARTTHESNAKLDAYSARCHLSVADACRCARSHRPSTARADKRPQQRNARDSIHRAFRQAEADRGEILVSRTPTAGALAPTEVRLALSGVARLGI